MEAAEEIEVKEVAEEEMDTGEEVEMDITEVEVIVEETMEEAVGEVVVEVTKAAEVRLAIFATRKVVGQQTTHWRNERSTTTNSLILLSTCAVTSQITQNIRPTLYRWRDGMERRLRKSLMPCVSNQLLTASSNHRLQGHTT